jgi:membrane fusion protein, multidrug efflux system
MYLVKGFIFSVVLLAVLFSGCNSKKNNNSGPRARQGGPLVVEGFIAEPHSVLDNIEVPGSLLPAEETQIRAEVTGRVVRLNIQEGAMVEKGALLVKLFDEDLQAQLKKLNVQLEIARKTEERLKDLLEIQGISQQEYDLSELQVRNLQADIESTQIAISKTEIRAPYRGLLGLRYISLGAFLSPNEVVTTLRKIDDLKLEFAVPEKYAKDIKRGSRIRFRVDGGVQQHTATVLATESGVDEATRTLRVRALVNSKNNELVPGIFARVSLQLGGDDNALMIPTQSVIPQARNKQVILFKKDSAYFTIVETGIRDSSFVQITKGIKPGDTVVTTGLMAIRPNSKIRIGKVTRYTGK